MTFIDNLKQPKKPHVSKEVKDRYEKKTYQTYLIKLRKVEDADCIDYIELQKNEGKSPSDTVKRLIRKK